MFASRLGLGLAALGRPGYINLTHARDLGSDKRYEALRDRAWQVLDAAWAGGVRYFDAARSYGRAEEMLAGWLRAQNVPPADVIVGSKWGYAYTAGWRIDAPVHEEKEHSLARLRAQFGESRALLGAQLDLYQIHSATLESGVLDNREVLDELAGLRAEHGVKLGVSVSGPRQADTIRRATALGLFDTVQATWNLLETSSGPALAEAAARGVRVIIKEALANGRLTEQPPAALARLARERGCGVDALAIAAVLAQPFVDVVLSGAAAVEHLRSNLASLELEAPALPDLAEPPEAYWRTRAALPWS
jgi:aryl-alcohol dehydrogenase-like predicted oxidoreductase